LQPAFYSDSDEPIVFVSAPEDFYSSRVLSAEEAPEEPFASEMVSLPEYVLRQVAAELKVEDRCVRSLFAQHLDEDGF
jgi:hypothetical protein